MDFKTKLLTALNISLEEYQELTKEVSLSDLEPYHNFNNIDEISNRISEAIDNKQKIVIYGDYDCDGIMATTILVKTFQLLNYQVGYYIPSRYQDGYGINKKMIEQFHQKNYQLIITVDNGVAQYDDLCYAKSLGIDVIVTDHHEIVDSRIKEFLLLHPFNKSIEPLPQCGAYIAFMLSIKLLNRVEPYLLSLAAVATISDMMPLKSFNRTILKLGLNYLNQYHFAPFEALKEGNGPIDETTIGFTIAPKINAVGRVVKDRKINLLVKYFLDTKVDPTLLAFILRSNQARKEMTQDSLKSIEPSEFENSNFLVVFFPDLSEGLIGLVAAHLVNSYQKPCLVLTNHENDKDTLKGSARSLHGFSLIEAFQKVNYLLLRFGGHELAGGVEVSLSNLSLLKEELNKLVDLSLLKEEEKIIIPLTEQEFNYDNYKIYSSLAPFGQDFPSPYFDITVKKEQLQILKEKHLKVRFSSDKEAIGFNLNSHLINQKEYQLIGNWYLEYYQNRPRLKLMVRKIK